MKLIKRITFIIIFLFININAFGAISYVDDIEVPANGSNGQNIPHGVAFNSDGTRMYVKANPYKPRGGKIYHSHYRQGYKRGPYKKRKKHLMGNAYYKAKREKNLRMVLQGRKGGRPRMYDGI